MARTLPVRSASREARPELAALFQETVRLYWRLTRAADAIHGGGQLSGPRRTLIVALAATEPQSVARLAAARGQSRQRLQPLINALIAEGLVERRANPFHKRSDLVALTRRGEREARQIVAAESRLRALLRLSVSPRALQSAVKVLRDVNSMFDHPDTLRMLTQRGRRSRVSRSRTA
jgi:DNA-binding MarR family transcriptional regulator